jgi:hypothetical protein
MDPIEKSARALCLFQGEDADDASSGAPRWTNYRAQVRLVIDALHEPNQIMKEAGSEIIRHVGSEETSAGHQSDAANVWRFMIDMLRRTDDN